MSDDAAFDALKRSSALQLVMKCGRLANEVGIARLRHQTGQPFRAVHTALFAHIDMEGTRLTEIARRVGHSKQAVGQLVTELVEMQVLERVPDPNDGRAKLVRFVGGPRQLTDGMQVLLSIERELAEALGEDTYAALHAALVQLETALLARA